LVTGRLSRDETNKRRIGSEKAAKKLIEETPGASSIVLAGAVFATNQKLHREGLTGLKTGHDSNTNYSTPKPHKYAIGTKVNKKWGKNNFIGEVVTRGDNGKENTYMIMYKDADKECVREKELDDIIMHPRHSL